MTNLPLSIRFAASMIGVSEQTLRRWDRDGYLRSVRVSEGGNRRYDAAALSQGAEDGLFDLEKMVRSWAERPDPIEPLESVYCPTNAVFQTRLQRMERRFLEIAGMRETFPLLTASAGEIGNNSFDHNLGNWPDVSGIFFAHGLRAREIVLCDRGIGILASLRRVRPSIATHAEALQVAFHEILTGRAPEHRGNGLKFVRGIISGHPSFGLRYQTGDALLQIRRGKAPVIRQTPTFIRGCLALISY